MPRGLGRRLDGGKVDSSDPFSTFLFLVSLMGIQPIPKVADSNSGFRKELGLVALSVPRIQQLPD